MSRQANKHFPLYDFDFDPMTLVLKLDPDIVKKMKMNFLCQLIQKLKPEQTNSHIGIQYTNRQTDRPIDRQTDRHTHTHTHTLRKRYLSTCDGGNNISVIKL